MDLIDFAEEYREAPEFARLRNSSARYVPGRGSERPTVMLLGHTPTALDTNERKAFSGQLGRVLRQLMGLAALSAEPSETPNAYLTYMVKYRSITRNTDDVLSAFPWVKKEWSLLGSPPVIVTLGPVPALCLLGASIKFAEAINNPHDIAAGGPIIWPMLHPAVAMYTPELRSDYEGHWHGLGAWLKERGLT